MSEGLEKFLSYMAFKRAMHIKYGTSVQMPLTYVEWLERSRND